MKSTLTRSVILLLFLLPFRLFGQEVNIRFDSISSEDGLSQNTVNCIFQDSEGFLWFGAQDGLSRYDGYDFKVYKHDPQEPSSISDNFITGILEGRTGGVMWIATQAGGINRFDRRTGRFTRYTHTPGDPNSLLHHQVNRDLALCGDVAMITLPLDDPGYDRTGSAQTKASCLSGAYNVCVHLRLSSKRLVRA